MKARPLSEVMYWRQVWIEAIGNMPVRTYWINPKRKGVLSGRHLALARCLGMNVKTASIHIYTARDRGSMPKDPKRRQLLLRLAHPTWGHIWAKRLLFKAGVHDRYYWGPLPKP